MLTKLRNFGKAKKGAELVEIILGVVIAVALMAVAITFITKAINENSVDNSNTIDNNLKPVDSSKAGA